MSTSPDNTSKMVAYADNLTAGFTVKDLKYWWKHFANLVQSLDIILKQVKHS